MLLSVSSKCTVNLNVDSNQTLPNTPVREALRADGVTKIIQDEEIKTGMVFIVLAFVHEDTKYYIL